MILKEFFSIELNVDCLVFVKENKKEIIVVKRLIGKDFIGFFILELFKDN